MKKFAVLASALFAFVVAGAVNSAYAIPTLKLHDSGTDTTVTVTDTDLDGIVNYFGAVGNFTSNISTGFTKPVIGNASSRELDLVTGNVSSQLGGILTISWFDDGFEPLSTPATMTTAIGGTTQGRVTLQSYLNGTLIDSLGVFSGGAFSGTEHETVSPDSPFSMELVATITHMGRGMTSFDAIAAVPEPSTLLLLGSGLVGLGLFGRRKKV